MTRSLFVYWKTDAAEAAQAAAAVAAFQRALRQRHAGLVTRLYRRVDDAPTVTLMETYARPGGIEAALQAEITDAGACARWRRGPRHVEMFEAWQADPETPDTPAVP